MITKKILKSYVKIVLGNPDVFVIMSEFVVLLATNQIWDKKYRIKYDLHKLKGEYQNIFDIHLPIKQDLIVLFQSNNFPKVNKVKLKYIGDHSIFK